MRPGFLLAFMSFALGLLGVAVYALADGAPGSARTITVGVMLLSVLMLGPGRRHPPRG